VSALRSGLGLNTYSFIRRGPVEDCLAELQGDFGVFELVMYPGHLWPAERTGADRARLRAWLAGAGLRVSTVNMPNIDINLTAAAPEMRLHTRRLLAQIIALGGELGAEAMVVGPGKANPLFPEPRALLEDYLAAALDELLPLARAAGIALWLENMPFAFLPRADDVMGFLDRYGSAELGFVYDVANAVFIGEDPVAGLARVAHRLRLVHLSDTGRAAYRHDPVGEGIVPFAAIRAALAAVGHGREPILEIISDREPYRTARDSAGLLRAMGYGRPPGPATG